MRIAAEADAAKVGIEMAANANRIRITSEAEASRTKVLAEAEAEKTRLSAVAEAERTRIYGEAAANAEAFKVREVGQAQAEAIKAVNDAIREGGDAYLSLKQLELAPQIAQRVGEALSQSKLINISGSGNAAGETTSQITGVIQTLLATQLVNNQLRDMKEVSEVRGETN